MAKSRTRRSAKRRVNSPEGTDQRVEQRIKTVPASTGKMHYIVPGSRNPHKVTRLTGCRDCLVGTVPVLRGHGFGGTDYARIRWMCLMHAVQAVLPMREVCIKFDLSHVTLPETLHG
jgi:hypothetical protein